MSSRACLGSMSGPLAAAAMLVGSITAVASPSSPVEAAGSSSYQAVPVVRLLDTRGDADAEIQVPVGRLAAGVPLAAEIAGVAGIPESGVAAVDLNVAVTGVDGEGFLAVYPCAEGNDGTARLNYSARPELGVSAIAVQVLAQLDDEGRVCIESSGPAHVIVDTSGYLPVGGPLDSIPAKRLLDTRDGSGEFPVAVGKPAPATPLPVKVTGVAGVPESGVGAVLLSVAAIRGSQAGFASVFPCADGFQGTANLNYRATAPIANSVIAPVDANGEICFYTSDPVHLIVDISAWFGAGTGFDAVQPTRAADTRDGTGGVPIAQLAPFVPLPIDLAGVAGVPTDGVDAVSLNVAVARGSGAGFVSVFPCDEAWNGTATLNFQAAEPISNAAITPIADDGTACVLASDPVDVIIDVNGWFGGQADAVADAFTVVEDSGINALDVLANDDGVTTVVGVTQPAKGSVAITNGGADLRYIPSSNFCNDGAPTDDFTYTADPGGVTATVAVSVTCVDDAPVAVDDAFTIAEDETMATTYAPLANDTDVDGGPISIGSVTQPADGTVAITNDGADLTYTPDADVCNDGAPTDDFTYTLAPGGSTATIAMTVTCVDDAPVAVDDGFTIAEDETVAVAFAPLANDTDVDGGPISIASVTQPANGAVVITGGGSGVTYTPDASFCNDGAPTDDFTYTLAPGGSTATVAMTVTCVDDAPVALDDDFLSDNSDPGGLDDRNAIGNTRLRLGGAPSGVPERALTGSLLDNDADVDSALVVAGVQAVGGSSPYTATTDQGGTVVVAADGTFTYDPAAGFEGSDTFTYSISDGVNPTVDAEVTIEVVGSVWYVDASVTGSTEVGDSANPFVDLDDLNGASADVDGVGDVIFLFTGTSDGTAGNAYQGGLALADDQSLIGRPAGLSVDGTVLVGPDGALGRPEITSPGGVIGVELADGVTVDSIATRDTGAGPSQLADGFSADGVGDITLVDVAHFGTGFNGFDLDGLDGALVAQGTITVDGPTVASAFSVTNSLVGGAIVVDALDVSGSGDDGVLFANNIGTVTVLDGSISGNTGTGLNIVGGSASVAYGGSVGLPDTNDGAVSIASRQGTTTLSGEIRDETGAGIDLVNNSVGVSTFSGDVTLSGGEGIDLVANPSTVVPATTTFSGAVDIDTSTADAVRATVSGGGDFRLGFTGGLDIDVSSTGAGIVTSSGTLDIVDSPAAPATINTVSGRALQMSGTSGDVDLTSLTALASTANGISLQNPTSTASLDVDLGLVDVTVGSGPYALIAADIDRVRTDPGSELSGGTFGGLVLDDVGVVDIQELSVNGTVGLTDLTSGIVDLTSVTVTSASVGVGVHRVSIPVTIDAGSISGTTFAGVDVDAGSADIVYSGSIDTAAGYGARVLNRAGSTVLFGGPVTNSGLGLDLSFNDGGAVTFGGLVDLDTGDADAIRMLTNDPTFATSFDGGLDIVTTGGRGIEGANAGALTVAPTAGVESISSAGTRGAIRLSGFSIGAGGATFDQISASNAFEAVYLGGGTGPGTFEVAGGAASGSGGTITGSDGPAAITVTLMSAPIVLRQLVINDSTDSAIDVFNAADVTIDRVDVTNWGSDLATDAAIDVQSSVGAASNAVAITGTSTDTIELTESSTGPHAPAIELTASGNATLVATVDHVTVTGGWQGVAVDADISGSTVVTVGEAGADDATTAGSRVLLDGVEDAAITVEAKQAGSITMLVDGVETRGAGGASPNDDGLRIESGSTASTASVDLTVEDSVVGGATSHAGVALTADANQNSTLSLLLRRSELSGGSALDARSSSTGSSDVTIGDASVLTATDAAATAAFFSPGSASGAMCVDIDGNTISGGDPFADEIEFFFPAGATFDVAGLTGGTTAAFVAAFLSANNTDGNGPSPLETSIAAGTYGTADCDTPTVP